MAAGQMEASRALGFSYSTLMRLVVVPQGVRRLLPALVNQFISLLKASSLVYFLGLIASQRELLPGGTRSQRAERESLATGGSRIVLPGADDPLTHLANYINARLRRGRTTRKTDDPLNPTTSRQEMV